MMKKQSNSDNFNTLFYQSTTNPNLLPIRNKYIDIPIDFDF